tara:strand:+ start:1377 stop:2051 length:675 start_codon:yes stop_codon:yes gene_type:complete
MSSIDDIKAVIGKHGGTAPSNRFNVIFTPPSQSLANIDINSIVGSLIREQGPSLNLAKNAFNNPRDISMLCSNVALPGRSIATMDHQDTIQSNKFPQTFIDDDVEIQFLLTNDYYMRSLFDNWMSQVVDPDTYKLGYKDNYSCDVMIQQLDQENVPVYGIKLEKAYPITMSSIELNQEDTVINKFSVTFAYDKFTPEGPFSNFENAGQTVKQGLLDKASSKLGI